MYSSFVHALTKALHNIEHPVPPNQYSFLPFKHLLGLFYVLFWHIFFSNDGPLLRRASFLLPSLVYISVIITHKKDRGRLKPYIWLRYDLIQVVISLSQNRTLPWIEPINLSSLSDRVANYPTIACWHMFFAFQLFPTIIFCSNMAV